MLVSAVVQFTQYFVAITQCTSAGEKCPLHACSRSSFFISQKGYQGLNKFFDIEKLIKGTRASLVTLQFLPLISQQHTMHTTVRSFFCTGHDGKQYTPHSSVTIAEVNVTQIFQKIM
jgi:hypothetical protein